MSGGAGKTLTSVLGSAGLILLLAAPARADLITINFNGQVDLTSEGGAVYQYSGFFTWNSNTARTIRSPALPTTPWRITA